MHPTRLLLIAILAGQLLAEAACAQTVMLPTRQVFRYSGSVLVPDRGTAYLGGNQGAAYNQNRRGGAIGQRSWGANRGGGGLSITTTIIDHQEIDRQLLGGSPQEFLRRERATEAAIAHGGRSEAAAPLERTAANGPPASPTTAQADGKKLVLHARRLVQQGELRRAAAAYRLAVRLLSEPLRTYAQSEYASVMRDKQAFAKAR